MPFFVKCFAGEGFGRFAFLHLFTHSYPFLPIVTHCCCRMSISFKSTFEDFGINDVTKVSDNAVARKMNIYDSAISVLS